MLWLAATCTATPLLLFCFGLCGCFTNSPPAPKAASGKPATPPCKIYVFHSIVGDTALNTNNGVAAMIGKLQKAAC
jgi:hypothetical protein